MDDSGRLWRLCEGDETVAEIEITEADFPWLHGRLRARPGLERWRPVFAEDLALSRHLEEHADADRVARSDELYERLNADLALVAPDGAAVAEFLLHVDGDEAWFRWIDAGPDE
ncbi:hypothetical protein [Actinorugispora endophytica]|uniref:Uncharacterized protein n=1 Tax=Actinorugispora endophytica TaxID=1605990 RepID=A0A4R6UKL1_9ACTN|nr:hypothetical protein [Actinorugispora endophytica]TDQ45863.1 hypothetical protein EV190_12820 [Actinorugispora endophytica]